MKLTNKILWTEGCFFTLSLVIELQHLKQLNGLTRKSFAHTFANNEQIHQLLLTITLINLDDHL